MKKFHFSQTACQQLLLMFFIGLLFLVSCKKYKSKPVVQNPVRTANVVLNGATEVPAVATNGSGTATLSYDPATRVITYQINWTLGNVQSTTTDMHFHGADNGSATISSPVVIPIVGFTTNYTGSLSGSTRMLTDIEVGQLLAAKWYLNIHSSAFPTGEIRGNILFNNPTSNPY